MDKHLRLGQDETLAHYVEDHQRVLGHFAEAQAAYAREKADDEINTKKWNAEAQQVTNTGTDDGCQFSSQGTYPTRWRLQCAGELIQWHGCPSNSLRREGSESCDEVARRAVFWRTILFTASSQRGLGIGQTIP
jgi:hypothetical protein